MRWLPDDLRPTYLRLLDVAIDHDVEVVGDLDVEIAFLVPILKEVLVKLVAYTLGRGNVIEECRLFGFLLVGISLRLIENEFIHIMNRCY